MVFRGFWPLKAEIYRGNEGVLCRYIRRRYSHSRLPYDHWPERKSVSSLYMELLGTARKYQLTELFVGLREPMNGFIGYDH